MRVDIMADPEYKVIELEAEKDNLKDEIILLQKKHIDDLEARLSKYESGVVHFEIRGEEKDVSSNMIDQRPVIRTTSEIARLLEQESLNAKERIEKDATNA